MRDLLLGRGISQDALAAARPGGRDRVTDVGGGRGGQHERRQQGPGMVLNAAQRLQRIFETAVRGGEQSRKVLGPLHAAGGGPPTWPEPTSGPGLRRGRPRHRSPPVPAPLGDGETPSRIPCKFAAFDAGLVGVQERSGAKRPCGTFAEALLAVPPSGAGPQAAAPVPRTQVGLRSPQVEDAPARSGVSPKVALTSRVGTVNGKASLGWPGGGG